MIVHLHIIGGLFVALSLLHVGFPRYFNWKSDLATLSLINRQMMQVHTLFIALVVFLIGILCLTSAGDLTATTLGRRITLFLGFFWVLRLLVQLFGYSPRLWKGKVFETTVHIGFTMLWMYASAVFLITGSKT